MDYTKDDLKNYMANIAVKHEMGSLEFIPEKDHDELKNSMDLDIKFDKASSTVINNICFVLLENVTFEAPILKQCNGENILFTSEKFSGSNLFIGSILDGGIVVSSSSER